MPKLFVALSVPPDVAEQLAAIQPQPRPGIRLVEPGQMHVTLHYIGEVDAATSQRMGNALATVDAPVFRLTIAAVGCFPPSKGATTAWAAVQKSVELISLHAAIASALAAEGFQPEARDYTPHLSLARCEADVPGAVMDDFLDAHRGLSLPAIRITDFGLYSTTRMEDVPHYQLERSFALRR